VKESLYKEVWLDNHQFMLEKHIYSDDFFNFFKGVMAAVPLPLGYVTYTTQAYHGIHAGYQSLPDADVFVYASLLD
jgi:hypothetical protein